MAEVMGLGIRKAYLKLRIKIRLSIQLNNALVVHWLKKNIYKMYLEEVTKIQPKIRFFSLLLSKRKVQMKIHRIFCKVQLKIF